MHEFSFDTNGGLHFRGDNGSNDRLSSNGKLSMKGTVGITALFFRRGYLNAYVPYLVFLGHFSSPCFFYSIFRSIG